MVLKCVVKNCANYEGKTGVTVAFHSFPSNSERRRSWIEKLNENDILCVQEIKDNSTVCSVHFTTESYVQWGKYKRLNTSAVPSVFSNQIDGFSKNIAYNHVSPFSTHNYRFN